jgi:arsenate reductase
MKKVFHLSTCSTCKRILNEVSLPDHFELHDIKTKQISPQDIAKMKSLSGSYESLFSRRAIKYRSLKLNEKELSEEAYKDLILEEYTFLKRPVVVDDDFISIGSSKQAVEALKKHFKS